MRVCGQSLLNSSRCISYASNGFPADPSNDLSRVLHYGPLQRWTTRPGQGQTRTTLRVARWPAPALASGCPPSPLHPGDTSPGPPGLRPWTCGQTRRAGARVLVHMPTGYGHHHQPKNFLNSQEQPNLPHWLTLAGACVPNGAQGPQAWGLGGGTPHTEERHRRGPEAGG